MSRLITLCPTLPKRGVWANQTVILPSIGEQTFDAQGNLAVSDDQVLTLLKETEESFGFTVLKAVAPDQSDAPTTGTSGEATENAGSGDTEQAGEQGEAPPLSEAQQQELNALSAKAEADQQVKEQLDGLDLPGLLKLAEEFPDLTKVQIAQMTDGKLRQELFNRLTK